MYGPPSTDLVVEPVRGDALAALRLGPRWVAVGLIIFAVAPSVAVAAASAAHAALVIVGTANHYWLDVIVAAAMLGLALAVVRLPHRPRCTVAHRRPGSGAGRPEQRDLGWGEAR